MKVKEIKNGTRHFLNQMDITDGEIAVYLAWLDTKIDEDIVEIEKMARKGKLDEYVEIQEWKDLEKTIFQMEASKPIPHFLYHIFVEKDVAWYDKVKKIKLIKNMFEKKVKFIELSVDDANDKVFELAQFVRSTFGNVKKWSKEGEVK